MALREISRSYVLRKSADQAVANSTTLTDDTDLSFAVTASRTYCFRLSIPFNLAGVVSGYKFQLSLPSGLTSLVWNGQVYNAVSLALVSVQVLTSVTVISGALATSGDHLLQMEGTVEVGGTGGSLTLQFAQNTSSGSAITVKKNATMIVQEAY